MEELQGYRTGLGRSCASWRALLPELDGLLARARGQRLAVGAEDEIALPVDRAAQVAEGVGEACAHRARRGVGRPRSKSKHEPWRRVPRLRGEQKSAAIRTPCKAVFWVDGAVRKRSAVNSKN